MIKDTDQFVCLWPSSYERFLMNWQGPLIAIGVFALLAYIAASIDWTRKDRSRRGSVHNGK